VHYTDHACTVGLTFKPCLGISILSWWHVMKCFIPSCYRSLTFCWSVPLRDKSLQVWQDFQSNKMRHLHENPRRVHWSTEIWLLLFIVIINSLASKVASSSFVAIFWNSNCSSNEFEFVSLAVLDFFWCFLMILGIRDVFSKRKWDIIRLKLKINEYLIHFLIYCDNDSI
jgi:hypothetical protein